MTSKYLSTLIAILILHFGVSAQKAEFKLVNQFTDKHQMIPFTNYAIAFPDSTYEMVEVEKGGFTYQSLNHPIKFSILPNESSVFEWMDMFEEQEEDIAFEEIYNSIKQKTSISSGNQTGLFLIVDNDIQSSGDTINNEKNINLLLLIGDSINSFIVTTVLSPAEYLEFGNSAIDAFQSIMYQTDSFDNTMDDFPFNFSECNKSMQFSKYFYGMMIFIAALNQNDSTNNDVTIMVTPTIKTMDYDTSFLKNYVISNFSFYDFTIEEIKLIEPNEYYGYQAHGKSDEGKLVFYFSYVKENQFIFGQGFADEYSQNNIDLFSNFIASIKSKN